jgi:predicted RNase H-like HicB family nuclease
MTTDISRYTYRVTWSREDHEHVGLCDELPGLSWLEKTPEQALAGIRRVVHQCVMDMVENGEPVPAALRR